MPSVLRGNEKTFLFSSDLSRNNISTINEENFKGQQNLLELSLSENRMEQVPSGSFKYLIVSFTVALLSCSAHLNFLICLGFENVNSCGQCN